MKIGVISDIHSNLIAFRECMKQLEAEDCEEYNDIKLKETGASEWPYIEEEYFEKAAYILGIPDYRK